MKITSVYIENFGVLHKMSLYMEEEVTVIVEKNGFGKSTLVAFITAMFYGLPSKGRQRPEDSKRHKYMPWHSGVFGGNLCFELDGNYYRIERTFGEKKSQDKFAVYEERTGNQIERFSEHLGEELFGIDEESFYSAICIAQNGTKVSLTDGILTALISGKTSDIQDDADAYSMAVKRLQQEIKRYKKTGQRGSIDQKKNRILQLQMQLKQMEEQVDAIEQDNMKLKTLEQEIRIYKKQVAKPIEKEHESINEDRMMRSRGMKMWKMFVTISVTVASMFLGFYVHSAFWVLAILSVFFMMYETKQWNRKQSEKQVQLLDVEERTRELDTLYEKMEQAQNLRGKIDRCREETEKMILLKEEIACLLEEVREEEKQVKRLEETLFLLEKAREELSLKYLGRLKAHFQYYMEKAGFINEKRGEMDTCLRPYMVDHGMTRKLEYYSAGTKDLIWLCLRMALVKSLFEKEPPILILDDPFTQLDETAFEVAQKIILEVSKEYQILYLTCHASRSIL